MTSAWTSHSGPDAEELAGRTVALHYGDPGAEYEALRTGAALVDRRHRARTRFDGPRAAELVTGLVTNDVKALTPGHGQYAAALSPKGKIIADVRVFALAAEGIPGGQAGPAAHGADAHGVAALLVDVPPRAAAGWMEVVRKYVNPRVVPYHDETDTIADIGVFGPRARHVLAEALGLQAPALAALAPYGHAAALVEGRVASVVRVPELEAVEGYELLAPAALRDALWSRLAAAGASPVGMLAWEVARVEAGRPEWGLDIDESTIPQEANLDELHAISYTKGCYTGQETVARVHFRGHVNRHLRGLRFAGHELPPARAQLLDQLAKPVGDVRTAVLSPRLGPIAIGMVRREVSLGDEVAVRWEGGETRATVVGLPFEG
jgi:tRNA-modifying protein YgfZ